MKPFFYKICSRATQGWTLACETQASQTLRQSQGRSDRFPHPSVGHSIAPRVRRSARRPHQSPITGFIKEDSPFCLTCAINQNYDRFMLSPAQFWLRGILRKGCSWPWEPSRQSSLEWKLLHSGFTLLHLCSSVLLHLASPLLHAWMAWAEPGTLGSLARHGVLQQRVVRERTTGPSSSPNPAGGLRTWSCNQ